MTAPSLVLTGERTLPGIAEENYWFRRHEAAYAWLAAFALGARVVDAGCGEGYGAALLRRAGASLAIGLDYLPDVCVHVRVRYGSDVAAVRGDLQRMPFAAGAVEVVANLQVLEHLHDQPGFLAECARVLRPAGTLLLTTPNRLTFSPGRDTPLNPFHTRELSAAELRSLATRDFEVTRLRGLSHGPRLQRWEKRNGSLIDAQLATPPEQWPAVLRRVVAGVRADDFVVSGDAVDASLDLVLVAYRR